MALGGYGEDECLVAAADGARSQQVQSLFDFLRAVGLEPIEWDALIRLAQRLPGENANPDLLTIVRTGFAEAHGAVVLFSPDDEAQLHERHWSAEEEEIEKRPPGQPRPNVLLEAGYALGYRFDRTLIACVGKIRAISRGRASRTPRGPLPNNRSRSHLPESGVSSGLVNVLSRPAKPTR